MAFALRFWAVQGTFRTNLYSGWNGSEEDVSTAVLAPSCKYAEPDSSLAAVPVYAS